MVTHHGHTITDHAQTWSAVKNHAWYHGQPLAREGGEERKSNGCSPIFYHGYFGDWFWPNKSCWTQKIHLAVTF